MLRRKARKDPVTPELREDVIRRDIAFAGGCVAAFLDATHECRDVWGTPQHPMRNLTLDHVQQDYGRMGKRAASTPQTLASLCYGAHLGGWATANRPLLREYLERANKDAAA